MNIVKGVAELIRRTSGGQSADLDSGLSSVRFTPPTPVIHFSEAGDEGMLKILWERFENAIDKEDKRKLLKIFLKQFLVVYQTWEPISLSQSPDGASSIPHSDYPQNDDHEVVGCSCGHPAEIIANLIEEVQHITTLIMDWTPSSARAIDESLVVLNALAIATRSMHNCRVLGYYGGIQKLTALMKACVVHLKEITSVLSGDESLPDMAVEKITLLQKILAHTVLVFCNFINLQSDPYGKDQLSKHNLESVEPRSRETETGLSKSTDAHISDKIQRWQQKAIVSLMEAGGLNWLVELLRVMRRLSMKEFWTDMSLQYLTLRTLRSALTDNPRGQNHFRSIGGLEVLLDGLGISSSSVLRLKELSTSETTRTENPLLGSFQLHVLSLQVLREAVFGNLNNLQFLCENGRVQKIANSFCSLAFSLQEYEQLKAACALSDTPSPNLKDMSTSESSPRKPSPPSSLMNMPLMQNWSDYVSNLSAVLCTFLLALETTKKLDVQPAAGRSNMHIPSVYSQLSVKWFVRVLLTVFPCIRACSNQTELPSHLRKFVYSLQRSVLITFRKVLVLTPSLLDVFRAEGVWDFFFSENFFYFAPTSDELSSDKGNSVRSGNIVDQRGQTNIGEFEAVKIEVISFMEFAATLNGSSQNLAECSILLDALEHSACNPEVAKALAECLLHILQLSEEKAGSSFKTLDAIPRVLKVACVQVHESQRSGSLISNPGSRATVSGELNQHWHKSIEASIQLFKAYFSGSDDAKNRVLHSKACIDSLLELFWEKSLRSCMLTYILELMKDRSLSGLDRNAKLYLCSKYLEAFTHVKEREINFTELSIDLLCGMQDTLKSNQKYYQDLFREAECFLHVVSLLNGNLDMANGEKLVLNVLQTLTSLLSGNDVSKASFRALVGKGHLTLQSLLLDFCQQKPSEVLLNALLDMLVDGKFDVKVNAGIKNEDVVLLYLSVLKKSSESSVHNGLNIFLQLLRDSISNRASCVRAGMLNFLLDWFSQEDNDSVVSKLAQLIQIIGGHSISGKDIRKIFALLRSDKVGSQRSYCSLLLNSMLAMLNEKGPTAFIELNGIDSGIIIKTPIQWPSNKGYSFTCWLRIENFPESGAMGLFSFLTENGKGCYAVLSKDRLIYESNYHKRQCISLPVNFVIKKWHFLCLTHTIGRAFSGGSLLRCYLDGSLVFSDKCRYAKVSEPLTICTIGTKVYTSTYEGENTMSSVKDTSPFFGQIGPLYMFNDAITSEQVQGIYSLGPSYMYSFRDNESAVYLENPLAGGVLDAKDGLASKIMFGLNSQASSGRMLFNISPLLEHVLDKNVFEAIVQNGSQLCSRRLLQQIIYCVGGVSVFFPLFTQSTLFGNGGMEQAEQSLLTSVRREHGAAEITELIASVLDDNLANQQQMLLLSGFSVLGFLLRSIPPQQLNLETLSALKRLFNVIVNCALSEKLVQDAISSIFLNPLIWLHTVYKVQRELYMFLIQQFDNDPRLLKNLCRLPRVLDIITEFYCDDVKGNSNNESKLHVDSMGSQNMERPAKEELHKIRLLLLSLGEMSLRQHILVSDIRALVTFFETNQDMSCIEDVLHMIIRAISQTQILASFLEQVNLLGGCHIFVNLLQREFEPIRLLGLQFIGRLLVGLPLEKKGLKFFNISVGKSKSLSDSHKRISLRMQHIFHLMSDRLFKFPQTEILCATLFDVLLGGASPKQVLQRHNQLDRQRSSRQNSQFFLPHILVLIFKFLAGCDQANMRKKILSDLLDLLDSNPSNIEALMEYGWNDWLYASAKLNVLKNYQGESGIAGDADLEEQNLVRNIYCVVLSHYIIFVRGGWQQLEDTVEFFLLQSEEGNISYRFLLRDVYNDLIQKLTELSSQDHILISQPCRDNTLYILKLVDEMLISENDHKLPFPASILDTSPDSMELDNHKDLASALFEVLQGEANENLTRDSLAQKEPEASDGNKIGNGWWNLYDNLWVIISEMNGKGSSKMFSRSSSSATPSLGQRARGLVESLNIPAAEMAAVVVSGGIGNALAGKPNKPTDKAMLLRGEKCPRIVFRLVVLYLCKSSLERACQCIQQAIPLLPCLLTSDDEQSKSRLQLFIWALLIIRSRYGMLDDGARFHAISRLIRETVNSGKSMLANSMVFSNEFTDSASNLRDSGTIHNLIQKDRVLAAVSDEVNYINTAITDRSRQLQELSRRLEESSTFEFDRKQAFEEEIKVSLNVILALDNSRRASFQLAVDEEKQIVTEKWMHTIRSLIDERGPWSANHFPNNIITHWKLDKTEDDWRRRQKLRRNYQFDERLCRPPSALPTSESRSPSESKSITSVHIPEQMKRLLLKGVRKITDEGASEINDGESESNSNKASTSEDASDRLQSEVERQTNDQKDVLHERKDASSPSTEPEDTEVLMSLPCVLVTSKRKIAGRLAVMKTLLHFFGELLVEGTGGTIVFRCFDSSGNFDSSKFEGLEGVEKKKLIRLPTSSDLFSERESVKESTSGGHEKKQDSNVKRHRRWNVCKIKGVHWTRYLLRYSAIEVFFGDSIAPIFLNFSSQKDAKDVGNLIVTMRNDALFPKGYKDKSAFISFIDRRVALEVAETARESWRRRDISNFEYLMVLNTLAGRSYNDLTQYPIFPWVLADYSSEVLDFNKSSTFRDLSKPVGALDPKRFEVFEDRYRSFCDPDIPSFYYGSHYSSMGIVLFYLIRLEPFTALHRNLQGGKFDHADRLFQSIEGAYKNCLSNTSDVKELIPEFFYMPDFLVNSNSYYFGRKQDGEPLEDICLPPWAKGSPEEFISKNREALESEYVSSNLHHWIDLVFGYKQRGKPAVEAANIFYYLTYEGAVDLETMEDELQRAAIEDQIANFGQTPIQIFRKKHPRRGPPIPIAHPLQFSPSSINLTSIVPCTTMSPSALIYVNVLDSNVVLINEDLSMSVKVWLTTQLQSGGNFTFSSSQDPFFGIGFDILSARRIGSPLAENFDLGAQCFATLRTSSENFLISCGNWENSFQIISLSDGRMVQSIRQHKDVVSCIAVTSDGGILATGSYDTTVMVWEVLRVRTSEKRARNPQLEIPRKDYIVADTPFHILCGHDDIITCLYVSVELDIVISGSKDGTCIFHTLREGRYVRSLQHPSCCSLSKLAVSRHGRVVLYADDDLSLHLYSINGKHIASSESHGRLNCVELSCCGDFLVCAGDQGEIFVRSMNTLEIVRKYSGKGKVITSLTVTAEECFLAGTKDGTLFVYSIENPQLRKTGVLRPSKSRA